MRSSSRAFTSLFLSLAIIAYASACGAASSRRGSQHDGDTNEARDDDAGSRDDDAGRPDDAGSQAADAGAGEVDAGGPSTVTHASLTANRDRLLDTYASLHGRADRCAVWSIFDPVQQGVFLTITDLLGKRSPMSSTRSDTALDHVKKLYAVNGADPTPPIYDPCGGGEYNRMFYEVDAELLGMFRVVGSGIPAWRASHDLGGPHAPFDQSDETNVGQPRGQTQFFSSDDKAVVFQRNGIEGILDPHMVEHDIDYDLVHNSDPQCTYVTGFGRDLYASLWTPLGNGGPEFDYAPSGCP